jgi:transposase
MLARIDPLNADIADLDAKIEGMIAPIADVVAQLNEILGLGHIAAAVIIGEIGTGMTHFPPLPPGLASWAKDRPQKKDKGATGHG